MMDINVNVQVNGTVKVVLDTAFDMERVVQALSGGAEPLPAPAKKAVREKPVKQQLAGTAKPVKEAVVPATEVSAEKTQQMETAAPMNEGAAPAQEEPAAKEPLTEAEVTGLRKAVADFIHADEGNKTKVKDWLTAHHLSRVPDITKDLLAEFNAFVGAE